MESKTYPPLDQRTISVTNEDGTTSEIPALDERWVERRKFVYFAPPLGSLNGKYIDKERIDEWHEHTRFYIEDLSWITGLPFHRFWSQLLYEKSSIQLLSLFLSGYTSELDDFLRYTIISDDAEKIIKSDVYEKIIRIKDLVFKFLARLVTHSESEENYVDREMLGKWLHQNELIKIADIFYLCKIYLASKSLKNFITVLFNINKVYVHEFRIAVKRIILIFDELDEQLKYEIGIIPLDEYRGMDVEVYKFKKLEMARSIIKILSSLWDISDNIITLCKMNSAFRRMLYSVSFDVAAAKFFDTAFFNLSKYVKYFKNMEEIKNKTHLTYRCGKLGSLFLKMVHIITTTHSSKFQHARMNLMEYAIDFMKRIDVFSGYRYFSTQYFVGVRILDLIQINSSPLFKLNISENSTAGNVDVDEFHNRWNGAFETLLQFMEHSTDVLYQQANILDRDKNLGEPPTQFEDVESVVELRDPETSSLISENNLNEINYEQQRGLNEIYERVHYDRSLESHANRQLYIDSQGYVLHLCDSDEETETVDDNPERDNFYESEFDEYMYWSQYHQYGDDRDGSYHSEDSSEEYFEELGLNLPNTSITYSFSDDHGTSYYTHRMVEEINHGFGESEDDNSSSSSEECFDFESNNMPMETPTGAEQNVRRDPPTEEEELALVAVVKQILNDLGEGFLRVCLQYYKFDTTNVIDAVLNDTLPPFLKLLDKDLEYIPSRDAITWKDEIDPDVGKVVEIGGSGIVDVSATDLQRAGKVTDKVQFGDPSLTPLKKQEYMTYNEMYKEESSKYNVKEMYEKMAEIYSDDEPNDTDFDMTKGSTLDQQDDELPMAQLYQKGSMSNYGDEKEDTLLSADSETDDGESDKVNYASTSTGNNYRGRGRERGADGAVDRRRKEKYKARVGNHNRRNLADRKRKFY